MGPNLSSFLGLFRLRDASDPTKVAAVSAAGALKVESVGRSTATATIASSGNLSGSVDLGAGFRAVRLTMPAGWTAAPLSFRTSANGTDYNELLDDSLAALVLGGADIGAGRDFPLNPLVWAGIRYLQIRSGLAGATVDQAAARDIIITKLPISS